MERPAAARATAAGEGAGPGTAARAGRGAPVRPGPPPRRRGWGSWLLALLLLAAAGGGGGWWWTHRAEGGGEGQAAAAGPPPPKVTVATPLVRRLVEWDEFTGRFEPVDQVEVRARVAGYLDRVHFEDGQIVEAGQLLFTIDQRPFAAAADEARAAVAAAESAVEQARLTEGRTDRLRQTNSPAFQRSNFEDQVQARLGAQAQLDQARAALAAAELDLGFSEITAPVRGRISDRRVDPGNLIGDTTPLTTIVSLDPIYFVFDMSEADFLAYTRAARAGDLPSTRDGGTTVGVRLVDEDEWRREGFMSFVDNVVDRGTGTVRGRATFPNADLLVTPGQFGTVRVPGSPEYDALLIPDAAIVTDQSEKLVMLVNGEGKVEPRPIRPGPREGQLRIVRRGLEATDKLIINGIARARPGQAVEVEEGRIEPPPALAAAAPAAGG